MPDGSSLPEDGRSDVEILAMATNLDGSKRFYPVGEHPAGACWREQLARLEAFPESPDRNRAGTGRGSGEARLFDSSSRTTPGESLISAEKCGLRGCGRTGKHEITVLVAPSESPKTILVCEYHHMMVKDADPAYSVRTTDG